MYTMLHHIILDGYKFTTTLIVIIFSLLANKCKICVGFLFVFHLLFMMMMRVLKKVLVGILCNANGKVLPRGQQKAFQSINLGKGGQ